MKVTQKTMCDKLTRELDNCMELFTALKKVTTDISEIHAIKERKLQALRNGAACDGMNDPENGAPCREFKYNYAEQVATALSRVLDNDFIRFSPVLVQEIINLLTHAEEWEFPEEIWITELDIIRDLNNLVRAKIFKGTR